MIALRPEQLQVLENVSRAVFEDEMVAHCHAFAPRLCELAGKEQVRVAVKAAFERAGDYGFTLRGPVRLFVELSMLFGSGFHSDPQFQWATEILQGADPEMSRANRLYERSLDYQDHVPGPRAASTRSIFDRLIVIANEWKATSAASLVQPVLIELRLVFPQRVGFAGDQAIETLICFAIDKARKHGSSTARSEVLFAALMFEFGHACTQDPLFPWIESALIERQFTDLQARDRHLEATALSCLEQLDETGTDGVNA